MIIIITSKVFVKPLETPFIILTIRLLVVPCILFDLIVDFGDLFPYFIFEMNENLKVSIAINKWEDGMNSK